MMQRCGHGFPEAGVFSDTAMIYNTNQERENEKKTNTKRNTN
jgi:hypothetical protein